MRYEIRALSFGEILDTSFAILRNHFMLLVGASAIMYVPLYVVSGLVTPTDPKQAAEVSVLYVVSMLLTFVYFSVLWPVVTASLAYAVSELYRGNDVTIGAALGRGWKLMLPLSGTAILAWTLTIFGFILLIVPGMFLVVMWMLWTSVAVLENTFGYKALKRSAELTRGYRWRAVGLLFVMGIVSAVLSMAVAFSLGFIPVLGGFAQGIMQSVSSSFAATMLVVMYFDLRCRKEQFDIEHLASIVSAPALESAPALP